MWHLILPLFIFLACLRARAAENITRYPAPSLTRADSADKTPNAAGFIQRWLILEPISCNGLTDSAVQAAVKAEYFPNQFSVVPRDGDSVTIGGTNLTWHAVDTKEYNVNLYHFAHSLGKPSSFVLFWAVSVVNCSEEIRGVRLAIGSNAASVWWVNGQEVIGIYGDRQTVIDDGVSRRLTLKKGQNIVRCAVINGGGATDFCARFLDPNEQPLTGFTVSVGDLTKRPDGTGAYATGKYRNLFAEIGKSQPEIRRKIDAAFQQLFHGNPTNEAVYYEAGTNTDGLLAFITDIKHHDVRSEGLSYGMIIAVQLNKKAEFDAIWNWSKTYLYVSETNHPSYGFFTWQARTNGARMSQFVAPDGEEYYVTALYLAARRWGNRTGIYNYKQQADELLSRMRHRPVITGSVPWRGGNRQVKAGPLFDDEHKMVLFSPSDERSRFTDPSYHLPAFYELWSRWGPKEDAEFWSQAADVSRDFFVKVAHPVTGLNPCYANFDGSLVARFGSYGTNFSYDAFRTAGNWSVDWSWWAKDPRQHELSDKLQAFFESQGTNYGCVFTLDGKVLETRHAQGLLAVNAVASLAATHPRWKNFVEELWNTPTPDGLERYYEGLLYMMALLHCSGEFRVW